MCGLIMFSTPCSEWATRLLLGVGQVAIVQVADLIDVAVLAWARGSAGQWHVPQFFSERVFGDRVQLSETVLLVVTRVGVSRYRCLQEVALTVVLVNL